MFFYVNMLFNTIKAFVKPILLEFLFQNENIKVISKNHESQKYFTILI